jgi:Abi-like protein
MQEQIEKIINLLSRDRFEACRYRGEDDECTLRRVIWNTALSEALYSPLQGLEVAVRNSIHIAISDLFGGPDWILKPGSYLRKSEREMMEDAIDHLNNWRRPITPGFMISELKFGFWTSLFDVHYDKLWHKIIKMVFPAMPTAIRTRKETSRRINSVRHLRNAVSHHHSIWHWRDLKDRHSEIYLLLDWIEPEFASFIRRQDRFLNVLSAGP